MVPFSQAFQKLEDILSDTCLMACKSLVLSYNSRYCGNFRNLGHKDRPSYCGLGLFGVAVALGLKIYSKFNIRFYDYTRERDLKLVI